MLLQLILEPQDSIMFGGLFDESVLLMGVFKFLFIVLAFFYILFAVIIIRQVQIMKNTLITPISPLLLILSFLHLIFAIGIFLLLLILL